MLGTMIPAPNPDLPCCEASAGSGGEDCTCWEPILAERQQDGTLRVPASAEAIQAGPVAPRRLACNDCAYRHGSPERHALGGDELDHGRAQPFYCHDGMPFLIGWRHPSGAVRSEPLEDGTADYHPRIQGGHAFRTDGRPAVLCAGWAAVNGLPRTDVKVSS